MKDELLLAVYHDNRLSVDGKLWVFANLSSVFVDGGDAEESLEGLVQEALIIERMVKGDTN